MNTESSRKGGRPCLEQSAGRPLTAPSQQNIIIAFVSMFSRVKYRISKVKIALPLRVLTSYHGHGQVQNIIFILITA